MEGAASQLEHKQFEDTADEIQALPQFEAEKAPSTAFSLEDQKLQKEERQYYEDHPNLVLTPTGEKTEFGMPIYLDQYKNHHSVTSGVIWEGKYQDREFVTNLLKENNFKNPTTGEDIPLFDTENEALQYAIDRDRVLRDKKHPRNQIPPATQEPDGIIQPSLADSFAAPEEQPMSLGDEPSPFGFQGVPHPDLKMMGREKLPDFKYEKPDYFNRFTSAIGMGLNKAMLGVGGLFDSEKVQGAARKRILELNELISPEILKDMKTPLWVPDEDPDSWTGWKVNPDVNFWDGLFVKTIEQTPHFALTIGTGSGLAKVGTNLLTKAVDALPIKTVQKLFKPLWGKDKGKFTLEGADKVVTGIGGAAGFGIAEGLLSGGFSRAEVGFSIRNF